MILPSDSADVILSYQWLGLQSLTKKRGRCAMIRVDSSTQGYSMADLLNQQASAKPSDKAGIFSSGVWIQVVTPGPYGPPGGLSFGGFSYTRLAKTLGLFPKTFLRAPVNLWVQILEQLYKPFIREPRFSGCLFILSLNRKTEYQNGKIKCSESSDEGSCMLCCQD